MLAEIDLAALERNLALIRDFSPVAFDAYRSSYGHGIPTAARLMQSRCFAVANGEATEIRMVGIILIWVLY